jgi:tetratricopeptide (TPR) repeat protein
MGKSSLMIRTARRLREEGMRPAIIDLTGIGTEVSAERWYVSLLSQLARRLRVRLPVAAWWEERSSLTPVDRLIGFMREVILASIEEPVVVFIDEVDTTLSLDFRDDFFASIRRMWNLRAEEPAFQRLTFVLMGVASPPELIKDPARTPFNIGHGLTLEEFNRSDAAHLETGLELAHPGQGTTIFSRIFHWTSGHPYLTQKLCLTAAESPDGQWTDAQVDEMVARLFLSEEARRETNLQFVQDKILTHPKRKALLGLYRDVVRGKRVRDDGQSPVHNQLKLSGLVKAEDGYLRVRNEIYGRTFDRAWVRRHRPTNWPIIVASITGVVALLAVALLLFNATLDSRCEEYLADFTKAETPDERIDKLCAAFGLEGILVTGDCNRRARDLFFGLSRDQQLEVFDIEEASVGCTDFVISELYSTLADVDNSGSTTPLLEAMAEALKRLEAGPSEEERAREIENWIRGRELAADGRYEAALVKYYQCISMNGDNAATLYERARLLAEYGGNEHQALSDLDRVMALARWAPREATPTPLSESDARPQPRATRTPGPELLETLLPAVTAAATGVLLPEGTQIPATDTATVTPPPTPTWTPSPTPSPTPVPVSISPGFVTFGDIVGAVRSLIYGSPSLIEALAAAPDSEYPNLREFGLWASPTPAPAVSAAQQACACGDGLCERQAPCAEDGHACAEDCCVCGDAVCDPEGCGEGPDCPADCTPPGLGYATYFTDQGLLYYERGDLERALANYERAMELDPWYDPPIFGRGNLRYDRGDLAGAIEDYERVIELGSTEIDVYLSLARVHRDRGSLAEALSVLDQAIELKPDNASAYHNRGIVRRQQGDLEGAIADCSRAIALEPEQAPYYLELGIVRYYQGDLDGALAEFEQAIALDPAYSDPLMWRAIVRRDKGDLAAAIADLDRAIEFGPENASAYHNRGIVRRYQGDLEGAIADLDRAIALEPAETPYYTELGAARYYQGDLAGALADFEQAIVLDPEYGEAYMWRGIVRRDQGDPGAALADLDRAIELEPENASAYHNRGIIRYQDDDLAGAVADLRKAVEYAGDAEQRLEAETLLGELEGK